MNPTSRVSLAGSLLFFSMAVGFAYPLHLKGQETPSLKNLILPGETFRVGDHVAFIFLPDPSKQPAGRPWVFYAPTLPAYPDRHEKWMHQQFLDAGIAVAGVDVGEAYGNAESRKVFDQFYEVMTNQRGYSKKPCLLGRSRGGLWVTSWACDHPERFCGLAGIYPVIDFSTYPGLEKAAKAYGIDKDAMIKNNDTLNPIARVSALAKAKLPVFIIHGDQDKVVPLEPNSLSFQRAYQAHGAESSFQLKIAEGEGHNFWEGFFSVASSSTSW